jgi:phage major head subunit gpT-like protein
MPFLTRQRQITRKEVRGLFAKSFITQARDVIWPKVCETIDTFSEKEYFAALGTVPQITELNADHEVTATEIGEYTYDLTNKLYKSLIRLRRSLLDFDQTGQSRTLLHSMAARVVNFPDKLFINAMKNGTSATLGLCITGSSFFNATHAFGSGTQSNLISGSVATSAYANTNRPDLAEKLVYDLDRALVAMIGWTDDQGEPIYQKIDPKDLVVVCSPLIYATMKMAVGAKFIKQTDNTYEGFIGEVICSNYLATSGNTAADWFLLNLGWQQRPFIYSRFRLRTDEELQDKLGANQSTGSPFNITMEDLRNLSSIELLTNLGSRDGMTADSHVILNEEFLLAGRWRGAISYGPPWTAVMVDNS